ncbi:MAG: M23 family metallopeptidase [Acidobacteria bacterium]|nr:M23 family metallopeptidase [Acidobacteriota bacterium]MBV9147706.1 M23 family metallopeptidase [Acidobacteriota bacterium]MBV9435407.1 M23 family metallopeptidase [Acidobacteriota bacterium]
MRALGFLLFLIVLAVILLVAFSTTPAINVPASVKVIGQATPITVTISDPHGVRRASAYLEQNDQRYTLVTVERTSRRFRWARNEPEKTLQFTAGSRSLPQLKDGPARLIVEATSNDFRGKTAEAVRDVTVATRPVTLSVDSDQHYLYVGMADLVTYTVSGSATSSGVRVADESFRGWPMPSGKPGDFSLFAFGWNIPTNTVPVVYATGPGGDEAHGTMTVVFPKREQPRYRVRDLQIDDKFMQKVVDELDPNGSGDLVARFVRINSEMRKANNETLASLKNKTEPKFLWSQPFQQQPNTKVEANFADLRNYIYHGQKIDQQTHLGYDLSSTSHVGVQASNDGRIVYAAPLGIYGNCIVVDHGYGLQTIYGHLSEIDVHEGDMVKRGQVMGKSGTTGMAGGDHIHFSMQLEGIQIDPKEWWDAHWIKDHIARRVELPEFAS